MPAMSGMNDISPMMIVSHVIMPCAICKGICDIVIEIKNKDIVNINTGRSSFTAFTKVIDIGADIPSAPCNIPPVKPA